jgi:exosome complex RNA-binding protein Rrp42 (RNase PH superfamily)
VAESFFATLKGRRFDGRVFTDIRTVNCEVGVKLTIRNGDVVSLDDITKFLEIDLAVVS